MSKKWIEQEFLSLRQYQSLREVVDDLGKALIAERSGKWKGLHLEIDYFYDDTYIVLKGQRLETDKEYKRRLHDEKCTKEFQEKAEKQNFERLKKKYG